VVKNRVIRTADQFEIGAGNLGSQAVRNRALVPERVYRKSNRVDDPRPSKKELNMQSPFGIAQGGKGKRSSQSEIMVAVSSPESFGRAISLRSGTQQTGLSHGPSIDVVEGAFKDVIEDRQQVDNPSDS
jgi:hypothetical protein